MDKLVNYLRKHLTGEVFADKAVLKYFSTDGSIFTVMPRVVVYPQDTTDVRLALRFAWQLAEKGQILPVTARGKGTDQAGGALGSGMIMVMPAHMNKLLGFAKTDVVVEPGLGFGELERLLHSHGRFLPSYPASMNFSTVGGAVANNAAGERTLKYGATRDYVKSLDVVLANGQAIRVEKLSAKELNRKKGQSDFEGAIYRQLDGLIDDNESVIKQAGERIVTSKNSAGYALWEVKGKDGSFDLSRLFVGSQGTLGIVTDITFKTAPYNPKTHLLALAFDDLSQAGRAVEVLHKLKPAAMELVDVNLLTYLKKHKPQMLRGLIAESLPKLLMLVEFDDVKSRQRAVLVKKALAAVKGLATQTVVATKPAEQERLWAIRRGAAALIWQAQGRKKALPIIEDGVVPAERLPEFLTRVYEIFNKHHLEIAVWGHAGDANLHLQPFLDVGNVGDRQLLFKLMDEFYAMVIEMGGSTCAEHNDGRLRAPYLESLFGKEAVALFTQVKQIFDPYGILNPGVKLGTTKDDMLHMLREEYSMPHLYDHMPHLN